MSEEMLALTKEGLVRRWGSHTIDEITQNLHTIFREAHDFIGQVKSYDRRCRAATFNALKQEGYRKISIRDNGDGNARIRYRDPLPETLTADAEKIL